MNRIIILTFFCFDFYLAINGIEFPKGFSFFQRFSNGQDIPITLPISGSVGDPPLSPLNRIKPIIQLQKYPITYQEPQQKQLQPRVQLQKYPLTYQEPQPVVQLKKYPLTYQEPVDEIEQQIQTRVQLQKYPLTYQESPAVPFDIEKLNRFQTDIIRIALAKKSRQDLNNWYAQAIAQAQIRKYYADQARQRTYEQLKAEAQNEAVKNSNDTATFQDKIGVLQKAYQQEQLQKAQDNAAYQAQLIAIQKSHQDQLNESDQAKISVQFNPMINPINNLLNNFYTGLYQLKSQPSVSVEPLPKEIQESAIDNMPKIETKVDLDKLKEIKRLFLQLSNAKVNGLQENPLSRPLNLMLNSVDTVLEELSDVLAKNNWKLQYLQNQTNLFSSDNK